MKRSDRYLTFLVLIRCYYALNNTNTWQNIFSKDSKIILLPIFSIIFFVKKGLENDNKIK